MLKLFKNFKKKEWALMSVSILSILCQVWLDLSLPDYMSEITLLVQTPGSEMADIWLAGGKMLLCALGSLAAAVVTSICAARISANFSATLRSRLFNKVQDFSMEEMGRFSTASLITRSTNDITQVQTLIVMGIQVLIKAPVTAVWAILKIIDKSWPWTLSTAVAVVILLCIVGICMVLTLPKFKKLQILTDNLNRVTRENLTGLRVVRAYNAEAYQENKFKEANNALTHTNLFTSRTMAFLMPSIQLVSNGLALAIYWLGAILINQAAMSDKATLFSNMVVFSSYAMQVVIAFIMMVMIVMILPRASVAANRINEVFATKLTIDDGPLTAGHPNKAGEIEFKHVSFKYPDAKDYILRDINFTVKPGETVAFIGSTGCGKSTVINLVPRFYDATEGEVLVDGINVKAYKQAALRNKIGYVSQKATLFSGTIASNVAYGDTQQTETSQEMIAKAIQTAQADDFVLKKEANYEHYVAQSGANFSGGQKQRLSIARAVYRKPEILIFDDAFSALDYGTDQQLRSALNEECARATKLIVAQRIGTIRDADQIIVLNEGRIVGIGQHQALMETCEVYRQIAYSQLSKEELA